MDEIGKPSGAVGRCLGWQCRSVIVKVLSCFVDGKFPRIEQFVSEKLQNQIGVGGIISRNNTENYTT